MMNFRRLFQLPLLLILSLALFSGCAQQQDQDDTRLTVGPGTGGLAFEEEDLGDFGDDMFGDPDSGLQTRDRSALFAEGDQVRGLLEPVLFAFDRSAITPEQRENAMAAVEYMEANSEVGIILEGHCDWRGTTEYNMGLGDRRATSVYNFMVDQGISPDRLEVLSRGDLEATVGGNEEEMAFDRRAEFVVVRR
ncbi:MAG: OmpA family protein [Opitutales bacterium]|nr:OmpA family protein [Opitutales bacterium]MCH8539968.1 OmpA family protein [Opitutales bacterium]